MRIVDRMRKGFMIGRSEESPLRDVLHAYLLGSVPLDDALSLQRRLVYQVGGDRTSGALLLCEHSPIISVGRQGSRAHILCEPIELAARQWTVRWLNRGGGCILHLPGQLAIYSIMPLDSGSKSVQRYLQCLHSVLVSLLADFSIDAETRRDRTGVWVGERLIATVSLAVRNWVAHYGAILNVNPDLDLFRRVRVGRPADSIMTSLERERRGPVRPSFVRERLMEQFASQFGFARTSLFHDSPALGRKATDAIPTRR